MKLREFFYFAGNRIFGHTPRPREFPFEVREQSLGSTRIQYAQWMHPKAYPCAISESVICQHQKYLRAGDVAIDIGAHSGDSTLPIAFAVGAEGCVLAFEANRYVYPTLKKNAELNPERTHIIPYNLAIAEADDDYEFVYNDPGFMNGGNSEHLKGSRHAGIFQQTVKGVNLTEFLLRYHPDLVERIRFIKIDAEGYDLAIAESIASLIDSQQPYVQIEVMKGTTTEYRRALYDFFATRNYTLRHQASGGKFMRSADDLCGDATLDLLCSPPTGEGVSFGDKKTAA